jgi:hypothetical protein
LLKKGVPGKVQDNAAINSGETEINSWRKNVQAATKDPNIRPLHADSYIYTSGKEKASGDTVYLIIVLRSCNSLLFRFIPYSLRNI